MNRFIHEISMLAALIVLGASLWQDWETLTTVKRMLVAYLCFFGLGAGLTLAIRAVRRFEVPETRPQDGRETVKTDI